MRTYQESLQLYAKVAREHGFETRSYGNSIVVVVPTVEADGSLGEQLYTVTNTKELREALGY